ncbi:hypothetical protein CEUSTIGMA_g4137.t1 [Chlamydomonas eustigma]|uniref:FAS1 domain-containing protein n=1 Tax=Chlamydomonas eustigma TaxID=1157962 RepID=A0A250X0T4_9CHLO|nr:hypothetical protein CEUSTIGMA_g4137.t1 [Chlamydomonas eustigma]|eukprot:GAX76691.1 hypothetical protein CEUSTIGMA_g4137.t1 [Chlamydomonas eustigma]
MSSSPLRLNRIATRTLLIFSFILQGSLSSRLPNKNAETVISSWPPSHFDTVGDALMLNPFLSILRRAINATSLYQDLNDPSLTYTILAPTNQAFGDLLYKLDMTERELIEDTELLMKVLKFHVIPKSALKADDIRDNAKYETLLQDQFVTFFRESFFFFTKITVQGSDPKSNPAMVIFPDVSAAKSIIHIINKVVLPEL